jgi:hypothetical protein
MRSNPHHSHLVFFITLLIGIQLAGCSTSDDPAATKYVVLNENQQQMFLSELSALSKAHGLTAAIGSATSDQGQTVHVLEARGRFLRLWAQNLPLSPGTCGTGREPEPDPNQFILIITPQMWLPLRDRAKQTSIELAAELRSKGYRVQSGPAVPCGRAQLERESSG